MDNIEKEAENLIKAMTADMENYTAANVSSLYWSPYFDDNQLDKRLKYKGSRHWLPSPYLAVKQYKMYYDLPGVAPTGQNFFENF